MKLIIAGTRWLTDIVKVESTIEQVLGVTGWTPSEVVSGLADGPDTIGRSWAIRNGIATKDFEPNWKRYPKIAGFMRNEDMGNYADALIAVWNGKSSGTKNMIDIMRKLNKPYRVVIDYQIPAF